MSTTGAILLAFLAFLVGYFSRRPVPLNQGRHLESINVGLTKGPTNSRSRHLSKISYEINAALTQMPYAARLLPFPLDSVSRKVPLW